jgi:hypothetical protein
MIWMRAASTGSMTRWPMRSLLAGRFTKAGAIDLPSYETTPVAARHALRLG